MLFCFIRDYDFCSIILPCCMKAIFLKKIYEFSFQRYLKFDVDYFSNHCWNKWPHMWWFKHHKFIISYFWRSEVWHEPQGAFRAAFLSVSSGEDHFLASFSFCSLLCSLTCGPSPIFKARNGELILLTSFHIQGTSLLPPSSTLKDLVITFGSNE